VGARIRRKTPEKIFFGRALHFFGSKSTISRFVERFRDCQYSLVSFLFAVLLLTVPPVPRGVGATRIGAGVTTEGQGQERWQEITTWRTDERYSANADADDDSIAIGKPRVHATQTVKYHERQMVTRLAHLPNAMQQQQMIMMMMMMTRSN